MIFWSYYWNNRFWQGQDVFSWIHITSICLAAWDDWQKREKINPHLSIFDYLSFCKPLTGFFPSKNITFSIKAYIVLTKFHSIFKALRQEIFFPSLLFALMKRKSLEEKKHIFWRSTWNMTFHIHNIEYMGKNCFNPIFFLIFISK